MSDAFADFTATLSPSPPNRSRGVPYWGDDPQAWVTAYLNGSKLPGKATVTGSGLGRRWDKIKTPGGKGASFVVLGFEPAQFTITLEIWMADQLRQLEQFSRILRPTTNVRGRFRPEDAVSVDHPVLAFYGIRTAIIMKPGFLEDKGRQVYELRIDFEEYFNQDKTGSTASNVTIVKTKAPSILTLGPGVQGRAIASQATPPPAPKPSQNNSGP